MLKWTLGLIGVWWRYYQTIRELEHLDRHLRADLGIDGETMRALAWRAACNGAPLSIYDWKTDRYESVGAMPARMSPAHRLNRTDCDTADPTSKTQLKRAA
ncbi:DUF1127 domain-containing protein [Pelagibacterium lentulum]|uniref:YjiS-like domain-containing protein n=1 Tax=Pelagibacterium lentulum TaxID=2029865 RepID=A0A916R7A2_9HYPH|nr:DUF1127 domain-containing protein [Pelagibacterium lentulum]GGA41360.1 hypothetical protein GCM10011499_08730 [Pelagibacterium lentulum]